MQKERYDVVVIGAGSGLIISSACADAGMKTAVIEQSTFGGTCLNRGCIPSKMFIHVADVMDDFRRARQYGIKASASGVDWAAIAKRIMRPIHKEAAEIEDGNRESKNITVIKGTACFVGEKTLRVGKRLVEGKEVVIAAGSRPWVPDTPGLEKVPYLTSDDVFSLKKLPKSIIFFGGGYIACELAHMFGTLGSKVTILQRSALLLGREDGEVAKEFTKEFSKRFNVMLNTQVQRFVRKGTNVAAEIITGGKKKTVEAELLVVATGRTPSADALGVKTAGVRTDDKGFVVVDGFMRSSAPGVWAIGDIAGKWMFKHSANLEAEYCSHNILHPETMKEIDYTAMPHAVFTSPQIAGVGMTEEECIERKVKYDKGICRYDQTGYGQAMLAQGFAKVLVDKQTRAILGCHIIGPHASILLHEVIVAMKAGLTAEDIKRTVHVHPALSEVVQRAFGRV